MKIIVVIVDKFEVGGGNVTDVVYCNHHVLAHML